jgi:hypothetical protein
MMNDMKTGKSEADRTHGQMGVATYKLAAFVALVFVFGALGQILSAAAAR